MTPQENGVEVIHIVDPNLCPKCPHEWHGLACRLRPHHYCGCATSYDDPAE